MRSRYCSVSAIILKTIPLRERDRTIVMLTAEKGLLRATARGAKKMTSPFLGRLQPFNICNVLLYENEKKRYTITQCTLEKSGEALASDSTTLSLGLGILNILTKTLEHDHMVREIYKTTLETFAALKKSETQAKKILIATSFYARLLGELGILPSPSICAICHNHLRTSSQVHNEEARFICTTCHTNASKPQNRNTWTKNTSKLLAYIEKQPAANMRRLKMELSDLTPVIRLIQTILNEHLPNATRGIDAVAHLHASLASRHALLPADE